MAKRTINWTRQALIDRIEILDYWIKRNRSRKYSAKLDLLFVSAVELVAEQPELGRKIAKSNTRVKIVKDYFIIYEYNDLEVDILIIWDSRRNPLKLKHRLKK